MMLALVLSLAVLPPQGANLSSPRGPTAHQILEAEYLRVDDTAIFERALAGSDPRLRRIALRALGRLERPTLAALVAPFVTFPDVAVRREAVGALAQMGAAFDFGGALVVEKDGGVRATLYEALGRAKPATEAAEAALVAGLKDADPIARVGAARGLEWLTRLNLRARRPAAATFAALRAAVVVNASAPLRQFALLALNAGGEGDTTTYDAALRDPDPQVRRLAVLGAKRWVDDPSPIVRLEAIRLAGTCDRAFAAVDDPSGHVALAAVDALGALKCDAARIADLVEHGRSWRVRARALVSLAKVDPTMAGPRLGKLMGDSVWQSRVYAANAARILKDDARLAILARDPNPNVAAAAVNTVDDAVRALASDHSGLLVAAAARLKTAPDLKALAPGILASVRRLSTPPRVNQRDARVALIERLGESGDASVIDGLRPLLADPDPEVAALVARVVRKASGPAVAAVTTRYVPPPFPSEADLRRLEGARAVITMKGLGSFTVDVLVDEAPATVATFASLVEKGAYNGLTFHRIVPNFVLQGGSPGADEYDALTPFFMRDELGFASNERGTLGTSTRGHDTGDGQIYVNLIDNWRLDHTYTVFARVVSGMDVVDRILEGDVIERVALELRR